MLTGFVGLNCVDIVVICEDFPTEDHDQKVESLDRRRGGNASNSCTVFSYLGRACEYFGSISSTDNDGKFLSENFRNLGIRIDNSQFIADYQTLNVVVLCNKKNHSRTILRPQFITYPEYSLEKFKSLSFDSYKWIHFEGRRNTEEIKKMVEYLTVNHSKIITSLEIEKTRLELFDSLALVDVAFISKDVAMHLGYLTMSEAVTSIVTKMKLGAILICPWGDNGAAGMCNRPDSLSGEPRAAVVSPACSLPTDCRGDSLGAGDTFIAGAVALLGEVWMKEADVIVSDRTLRLVLDWANYLAGFKCEHVGFDCVSQCREMLTVYVNKIFNC